MTALLSPLPYGDPLCHLDRQPWDLPPEAVTPIETSTVPAALIAHAEEMRTLGRLTEDWGAIGHHQDAERVDYVYYAARLVDGQIEFGHEDVEC